MSIRSLVAIGYLFAATLSSTFADAQTVRPFGWPTVEEEVAETPVQITARVVNGIASVSIEEAFAGWDDFAANWNWEDRLPPGARIAQREVSSHYGVLSATLRYTQPVYRIGDVHELMLPVGEASRDALDEAVALDLSRTEHEVPGWLCARPYSAAGEVSARIEISANGLSALWSDSHDFDMTIARDRRVVEIDASAGHAASRILLAWIADGPVTAMVTIPVKRP
ncbi:MAG: hypothetical protein AAF334_04715 [Pseudomonadota bacterium]